MSTAASIDDLLGPAAARFFGAGYRAVRHELGELEIDAAPSGAARVRGTTSLLYPEAWSRKGSRALVPHVSSIDAFVVATELVEVLLAVSLGLRAEERASAWVRSLDLRSGTRPQEDLGAVPVSAELVATAEGDGSSVATVEARVGTLTVVLGVVHPPARGARAVPAGRVSAQDVLGPASARFHAGGYVASSQHIADVELGADAQGVRATVVPSSDVGTGPFRDLGSSYLPGVTFIDAIVGLAQVSEVLLYALDAVDRARSNTMWMRRVRLETPEPGLSREPFATSAQLRVARLVPLHGATWRAVEMTGQYHRISARYALAHELPSRDDRSVGPHHAQPGEAA